MFHSLKYQCLLTAGLLAAMAAPASAARMYVMDGDSSLAWIVDTSTGTLESTFSTYSLAYPVAVTDTVRVAHRDNADGAEYTADGTPTGTVFNGGSTISQLLDGTTDGSTYNYAVSCCGTDGVYRADRLWQNTSLLFALPEGGQGIAYDPVTATLWVSTFNTTVTQYSLAGLELFSFSADLAGLAYDSSTDSFWGYANSGSAFTNFNRNGNVLNTFSLSGRPSGNPYGGEIAMASPTVIPEPGTVVLLGAGMLALALRRRIC